MTKVEELRTELYKDVVANIEEIASAWGYSEWMTEKEMRRIGTVIDFLIAAADARGFTRGVAAERERIRKAGVPISNVTFSPDGKVMRLESDGRDQIPSYFIPASVLTPKEREP